MARFPIHSLCLAFLSPPLTHGLECVTNFKYFFSLLPCVHMVRAGLLPLPHPPKPTPTPTCIHTHTQARIGSRSLSSHASFPKSTLTAIRFAVHR